MRIRNLVCVAVTLALLAGVGPAAAASKTVRKTRAAAPKPRPVQTFNASGPFTGVLAGEIRVGETTYRVSPDVQVYEIGNGPIPAGAAVTDRLVYLSGVVRGNSQIVDVIIVRPADELLARPDDPSQYIHEKDPSSPE